MAEDTRRTPSFPPILRDLLVVIAAALYGAALSLALAFIPVQLILRATMGS